MRASSRSCCCLLGTSTAAWSGTQSKTASRATWWSSTDSSPWRSSTSSSRATSPGVAETADLLHAQVGLLHVLRLEQLLTRSGLDDDSGLQHIAAMRDLQRFVSVLFDEQHGRALRIDLAHDAED